MSKPPVWRRMPVPVLMALVGVALAFTALFNGGNTPTGVLAASRADGCVELTHSLVVPNVSSGSAGNMQPIQPSGALKTENGVRIYCPPGASTPSPTSAATGTATVTNTATASPSATSSAGTTASPTRTNTNTPTGTAQPTQTSTMTPSPTATVTIGPGSPTPTQVTSSPTATATPTFSPTATPTTATPTSTPTPTPSPTPTQTQVSCTPDPAGSYGYESPPNNFEALVTHLTICPGVSEGVQYKPPTNATSVMIQVWMDKTQMPSNAQEAAMVKVGDTWTFSFTARTSAPCEGDPSCGPGQTAPDTSLVKLYIQFRYVDASGSHTQLQRFK